MEIFEDFCLKSSFHGLHNVGQRNAPAIKKGVWFLIFLGCLGVFSYLACKTMEDFLSRNTKIQMDESHADLGEVTFPGVVICNNNQFRRSFVYWIINYRKGVNQNQMKLSYSHSCS